MAFTLIVPDFGYIDSVVRITWPPPPSKSGVTSTLPGMLKTEQKSDRLTWIALDDSIALPCIELSARKTISSGP